jgi:hypothetical protein
MLPTSEAKPKRAIYQSQDRQYQFLANADFRRGLGVSLAAAEAGRSAVTDEIADDVVVDVNCVKD